MGLLTLTQIYNIVHACDHHPPFYVATAQNAPAAVNRLSQRLLQVADFLAVFGRTALPPGSAVCAPPEHKILRCLSGFIALKIGGPYLAGYLQLSRQLSSSGQSTAHSRSLRTIHRSPSSGAKVWRWPSKHLMGRFCQGGRRRASLRSRRWAMFPSVASVDAMLRVLHLLGICALGQGDGPQISARSTLIQGGLSYGHD